MTQAPLPDDLDALLDELPPAGADQGNPGHDMARAHARRTQAVRLRMQGATYEQIAETAGYSDRSAARQAVVRALARYEVESVTELRTLENARLDADELALRTIIADPQAPAAHRIAAVNARTRLSGRRASLNGLDAPMQLQISSGAAARLQDVLANAEQVVLGLVESSTDLPPALEA